MKLNKYKVNRDHARGCGFFRVNVEEIKQWGFGFQISVKGIVYGFSITNV